MVVFNIIYTNGGVVMARTKVRLSPADVSEKWGRRLKAAVPDITKGIDAVTEDPGEKAVAKVEKMRTNILKALDEGIWQKRRLKITMAQWKDTTKRKVTERLASGADAAMPKRREFDTWLVNRLNAVLPDIAAMPDLTLEDSIARVRRLMEHMAEVRFKAI